ncbi:MAG: thiamine-phosphate kinase [Deltaproteobacteria bacterium]|nr:thiamine-phosphate kinase [Deltaproteobacteria bacterium]
MSEDEIIATIVAAVPHAPPPAGPGDDAAILAPGPARALTTDALVEGTHFVRGHPPEALGWKALAVNLSDVAAMGATPEAFTLALALPPGLDEGWVRAFAAGLGACARGAGVSIAGGDTVRGERVVISITAWGTLAGPPLRRAGGKPGDVLLVRGDVGRSGVGLARWLADPRPERKDLDDPVLAAHLRPEPPLDAGPLAARAGASAGLDLSDGLATDLPRLARASQVDLVVDLDRLPADPLLADVDARARAATGEDYGLAVLAPPDVAAALEGAGFVRIGHARAPDRLGPDAGRVIWRERGLEVAPVRPAFAHFES